MMPGRPHEFYKAQSQRAQQDQVEWNDEDDFRNTQSRRLSFFSKSEHGRLFTQQSEERNARDGGSSKLFVTRAFLELPLALKEGDICVEKNVKTRVHCEIPPRAGGGKWSVSLGGSSMIRGQLGCATGSIATAYHLSPVTRVTGGMNVGDSAGLHVGTNRSFSNDSNLGLVLYSQPYEQCVGTCLKAERTWNSLVETRLSLDCASSLKSIGSISLSTLMVHRTQIDLGWSGKHPWVQLELRPKISQYLYGNLLCGWNDGLWRIGAFLSQSLTFKFGSSQASWPSQLQQQQKEIGSLGLGVQYTKKGLAWIVSWSQGGVHVRVPIRITDRPLDIMYPVQALYLSVLTSLIQGGIAHIWNSTTSTDKERQWNQHQQLLLRQSKAKRDAEQQKQLMIRQAAIRTKDEEEKNGLVILEATYRVKGGDEWDVTTQLQFWTLDASLELPASSKQHLLGFYDINQVKPDKPDDSRETSSWWTLFWIRQKTAEKKARPTLTVKYQFSGDTYQITVKDHEALVLPNARAIVVDSVQ